MHHQDKDVLLCLDVSLLDMIQKFPARSERHHFWHGLDVWVKFIYDFFHSLVSADADTTVVLRFLLRIKLSTHNSHSQHFSPTLVAGCCYYVFSWSRGANSILFLITNWLLQQQNIYGLVCTHLYLLPFFVMPFKWGGEWRWIAFGCFVLCGRVSSRSLPSPGSESFRIQNHNHFKLGDPLQNFIQIIYVVRNFRR